MKHEQYLKAVDAVEHDATIEGRYFGDNEGESCAVGGMYIAADSGHEWDYYLDLSIETIYTFVEDYYGIDGAEHDRITSENDQGLVFVDEKETIQRRRERVIAELWEIYRESWE